jgi:hypothetical protein
MTQLKEGTRIKLLEMPHDPFPIKIGDEGTVKRIGVEVGDGVRQVFVKWDTGRTLILLDGIDRYEILEQPPAIQE